MYLIQKDHIIVFFCCLLLIFLLFLFPGNVDMVNLDFFSLVPVTPAVSEQPVVAEVGQPLTVDQVETVVTDAQVVSGSIPTSSLGDEYILVNIRIQNFGSMNYDYSPFDFYVESSSGIISTDQIVSLPGYTDDARLSSSLVPDHGDVAGYLVFQCFQRDHNAHLVWTAHTLSRTNVQMTWNINF